MLLNPPQTLKPTQWLQKMKVFIHCGRKKKILPLPFNSITAKRNDVREHIGIEIALAEEKHIPEEIDFHVTNLRIFWKLGSEPQGSQLIYLSLLFAKLVQTDF